MKLTFHFKLSFWYLSGVILRENCIRGKSRWRRRRSSRRSWTLARFGFLILDRQHCQIKPSIDFCGVEFWQFTRYASLVSTPLKEIWLIPFICYTLTISEKFWKLQKIGGRTFILCLGDLVQYKINQNRNISCCLSCCRLFLLATIRTEIYH